MPRSRQFIATRSSIPETERRTFAGSILQMALALGLKRCACEVCGQGPFRKHQRPVHGHHDSYFRPLDVRWLCARCHRNWHVANGPGEGRNEPITIEEKQHWLDELRRRYTRAA